MTTPEEQEIEVRIAMGKLSRAMIERDVATIASLLDDDFTGCDPAGVIVSKQQWLDDVANGDLAFQSIDAHEVKFTPLDDAVRVHAELTFRARYNRSNYNGTFRCLGMYVKRGDQWRLLVSKARVFPSGAAGDAAPAMTTS